MAVRRPNNYFINEEDKTVRIELRRRNAENMWTIIDLEDLEYVTKWTWYARYNRSNQCYYATHTVYDPKIKDTGGSVGLQYYLMNRDSNPEYYIDHINHDTLDNRKNNLRVTTNKYNLRNRHSKNSNNTTGYRNVIFNKRRKKKPYVVQLQINGKNKVLGTFEDVHEAGEFAEEMRQKYYGEFAGKT